MSGPIVGGGEQARYGQWWPILRRHGRAAPLSRLSAPRGRARSLASQAGRSQSGAKPARPGLPTLGAVGSTYTRFSILTRCDAGGERDGHGPTVARTTPWT